MDQLNNMGSNGSNGKILQTSSRLQDHFDGGASTQTAPVGHASRNGSAPISSETGAAYFRDTQNQPTRRWTFYWKGALDLSIIFLTLPLWLPLMLLIAIWVKATSPGPAFFRQRRIGFQAQEFFIFKFRTMKVNAETASHEHYLDHLIKTDSPMTKLDATGDPRLIPGGALLRASGLDELPQILNVLQGEMSLVGPRPCTPHEFERYEEYQKERVKTPPGLTGYWQTHGKNNTTFSQMIAMDIYYARNVSLMLDLSIIARTLPVLLGQIFEAKRNSSTEESSPRQLQGPVGVKPTES